ncbi:hypothetical protein ACFFX0_30070 [Citricoccus parietis]|uniref:Uncharacterized protein n=1 Tax=Citricoccus parietis TaxID=592307 RepID=A0ABV5G8C3_9MICC
MARPLRIVRARLPCGESRTTGMKSRDPRPLSSASIARSCQ